MMLQTRSYYFHKLLAVTVFFTLSYLLLLTCISHKQTPDMLVRVLSQFIQILYLLAYVYGISLFGTLMTGVFFVVSTANILSLYYIGKNPAHLFLISMFTLLTVIIVLYKRQKLTEINAVMMELEKKTEEQNLRLNQKETIQGKRTALQKGINKIMRLRTVAENLTLTLSLESLYSRFLLSTLAVQEDCDGCVVYTYNSSDDSIHIKSFKSRIPDIKRKDYENNDIFCRWVLKNRRPISIEDIHSDFRFDTSKLDYPYLDTVRSSIIVPLITRGTVLGLLRCDFVQPTSFSSEDIQQLSLIGHVFALSISIVKLYHKTKEIALKDGLTQLYVRRYMDHMIISSIEGRSEHMLSAFSLLLLDLDHFKKCNDTYGHIVGDKILIKAAHIIQNITSAIGLTARYGGEEFLVFLPGKTKDEAAQIAEDIRKAIEATPIRIRRGSINITISIGVAAFPVDGDSLAALLRKADKALYTAKRTGRNKVISQKQA